MRTWQRNLLKLLSFCLCVLAPAGATLYYFPILYREHKFEIVLPTVAVLCLCVCMIPLFKWISKKIKSPAVWMVWLIMFFMLYGLEKIISQMVIISGIGAVGNIIGAILWKIASRGKEQGDGRSEY